MKKFKTSLLVAGLVFFILGLTACNLLSLFEIDVLIEGIGNPEHVEYFTLTIEGEENHIVSDFTADDVEEMDDGTYKLEFTVGDLEIEKPNDVELDIDENGIEEDFNGYYSDKIGKDIGIGEVTITLDWIEN